MAAIRGRDTKPELIVRRGLHARGFRFRLHAKNLPGRPDLVFPKHRAVVLVNGCFWHGHDCPLFKWPASREQFWHDKISANIERDIRNRAALETEGWHVAVVWECALKGRGKTDAGDVIDSLSHWLLTADTELVIEGFR
ncbi:very short patch repair protein [Tritonibacter horizontis]|uniref:Very short patch repair endonuclease n=2 Tax=Tritonibacter horizontis TaxID=1768241 RepID=A0A132BTW0_9RHOB|nr:very short patch repair protein [Tritonibacter horizontis]